MRKVNFVALFFLISLTAHPTLKIDTSLPQDPAHTENADVSMYENWQPLIHLYDSWDFSDHDYNTHFTRQEQLLGPPQILDIYAARHALQVDMDNGSSYLYLPVVHQKEPKVLSYHISPEKYCSRIFCHPLPLREGQQNNDRILTRSVSHYIATQPLINAYTVSRLYYQLERIQARCKNNFDAASLKIARNLRTLLIGHAVKILKIIDPTGHFYVENKNHVIMQLPINFSYNFIEEMRSRQVQEIKLFFKRSLDSGYERED